MSVSIESVREMEWGSAVSTVNSNQLAFLHENPLSGWDERWVVVGCEGSEDKEMVTIVEVGVDSP